MTRKCGMLRISEQGETSCENDAATCEVHWNGHNHEFLEARRIKEVTE